MFSFEAVGVLIFCEQCATSLRGGTTKQSADSIKLFQFVKRIASYLAMTNSVSISTSE